MGKRKMIWLPILLMVLLCTLPAVQANATDPVPPSIWVRPQLVDGSYVANICADATVTDGVITLHYDSSLMSFQEVIVDNQYVAVHAVNAQEPGVVKIAWVAPGDYGNTGATHILMQVCFTNVENAMVVLDGVVHGTDGRQMAITVLNFSVVPALAATQGYKAEDYTAESFAVLQSAIANAEAVIVDLYSTQGDMDAAALAVKAAIDGLERAPVVVPTEPTQPTQPETKPTQPTTQPTQPAGDPAPEPDDGSGIWVAIVGAMVAVGIMFIVILRKKEVRK